MKIRLKIFYPNSISLLGKTFCVFTILILTIAVKGTNKLFTFISIKMAERSEAILKARSEAARQK